MGGVPCPRTKDRPHVLNFAGLEYVSSVSRLVGGMADGRKLSREDLTKAFTMMGEILARDRVMGEIAVYGGSAILLQMEYRENTADVDCVIKVGHGPVVKAMLQTGLKLNLPSSWLNENVSAFASMAESESDFIPFGAYPSDRRPFLKVRVARPEYLLAMKVEALERGAARDRADIAKLCGKLGLSSVDEVLEIRGQYFNKPPTLETRLRVEYAMAEIAKEEKLHVDPTPKKPT